MVNVFGGLGAQVHCACLRQRRIVVKNRFFYRVPVQFSGVSAVEILGLVNAVFMDVMLAVLIVYGFGSVFCAFEIFAVHPAGHVAAAYLVHVNAAVHIDGAVTQYFQMTAFLEERGDA